MTLPKELAKSLKGGRLLTELEWRQLHVQQSKGWVHYAIHRPEPHILLFRRELGTCVLQSGRAGGRRRADRTLTSPAPTPFVARARRDPNTGKVNAVLRQQAIDAYNKEFKA